MSRLARFAAVRRVPGVERTDGAYLDPMEDACADGKPGQRSPAAPAPSAATFRPQPPSLLLERDLDDAREPARAFGAALLARRPRGDAGSRVERLRPRSSPRSL